MTEDLFEGAYGCKDVALHPFKPYAFIMTIYGPIGIINYGKYKNMQYPAPFWLDGYYMDPT